MKKSIAVLGMILVLMVCKTSAQTDVMVVRLNDGANSISLPGGNTLNFNFRSNAFSNFTMLDSLGIAHPLTPSNATVGTPRPVCQTGQVRESYASSQKDIGVCLCKPTTPPTGATSVEYALTIDMPIATNKTKAGKALNRRVEVKLSK